MKGIITACNPAIFSIGDYSPEEIVGEDFVSSGYSTDPIMANFRQYGFSGVVAKPYKVAELEKAIQDAISESGK